MVVMFPVFMTRFASRFFIMKSFMVLYSRTSVFGPNKFFTVNSSSSIRVIP